MGTSSSLVEEQLDRHLVPPGDGAKNHLDRELKIVFTFLILGWLAALALLIVNGLIGQGVSDSPFVILADIFPGDSSLLLAAAAAVLPLIVLLVWRLQAGRRAAYQKRSGCPRCAEQDFVRIHRHRFERTASSLIGLSTQRLACRNCAWIGLLVSGQRQDAGAAQKNSFPVDFAAPAVLVEKAVDVRSPSSAGILSPVAEDLADAVLVDDVSEDTVVEQEGIDSVDEAVVADDSVIEVSPPIVEESAGAVSVEIDTLDDDTDAEEAAPAEEPVPPVTNGVLYVTAVNGDDGQIALAPVPKRGRRVSPEAVQPDSVKEAPKAVDLGPESSGKQEKAEAEKSAIDSGALQAVATAPFGLKVRREPRTDAEVLKVVAVDSIVTLLVEDSSAEITTWQKVSASGTIGWVSSAFLRRLTDGGSAPAR